MVHKLLIIDDNHSFIDTLQVMLKGLPLQYESVFRYNDAEKKINEFGSRINNLEAQKILQYAAVVDAAEKQKESAKSKGEVLLEAELPAAPVILQHPLVFEGYSLIIVEQDTEPGRKGFDFIQSILRTNPTFSPADFLLLTGRAALIEERARAAGITVLEKPLKNNQMLPLVQARLEYLKQQAVRLEQLIERYGIEIGMAPQKPVKSSRKAKPAEKAPPEKRTAQRKTVPVKPLEQQAAPAAQDKPSPQKKTKKKSK